MVSPLTTDPLPRWTPDMVCERMIEAFRKLPKVPVYSPQANVLQTALPRQARPADLDLISLSAHYLARNSEERRFLLAWASARASGRSVREVCREMGWPRENFRRKRHKACKTIAERLNRDGIPAF
jgi:hypothetical protein